MLINFGALAAEREKDALRSVFISSPAYERLAAGNKIIVLGNRGAGKTAMLSMLAEEYRQRGDVVVDLPPEDFAYELLSQTLRGELQGSWSKHGAYAAAWKYLLYVTAMKGSMQALRGLKRGSAKRIHAYLRDHHSMDLSPISTLVSYLKRLESIKIGAYEATAKARELQRLYRLEEIDGLLDDLEDVCTSKPVLLVVDELDRGWDASEDAIAFVAGLFQAGTSIGVRTPHVRLVMSLRRELYENIPALYEDAQKVRDAVESIDWTSGSLFRMISRRIGRSLGEDASGLPNDELWTAVMPPTVQNEPSFDEMLDFTFFRPRELIQLCGQVQDVAFTSSGSLPFPEDAVLAAQSEYSRERFNDVVAEYRFQFPGIGSIFETFRGSPRGMSRSELELRCLEIAFGDKRVAPEATWVVQSEPDQIIDVLWRVGFLKCAVKHGNTTEYLGVYEKSTINTRNVDSFHIHDMFATYLGSR